VLSETASSAFQLGVQYATELACNVVNKAIVDMRLRPRPVMPLVDQSEYIPQCEIRAARCWVNLGRLLLDIVCKHDVISKTGSTQFRQNKPVARAAVIGNAHDNNYGEIGLVVPEKFSWTGMQTDRHARSSQYAASLSAAE